MSKFEDIAEAIEALFSAIPNVTVKRNDEIPEKIPSAGIIIIHDGREDSSEQPLGGFSNTYHRHEFEIEAFVQSGETDTRNATLDGVFTQIGIVLENNPTLDGLISGMDYGRPEINTEREPGSAAIKSGILALFVEYETTTPLG